jgi:hypothetical protein
LKARISESLYGGRFEFDNLFSTTDLSHVAKSELQKNTAVVKSPSLLQIVERLERLANKLPSKIRKAVLNELTPLKQLFLQQRPPRFLFAGSSAIPLRQVIAALFGSGHPLEHAMFLSELVIGTISACPTGDDLHPRRSGAGAPGFKSG